MLPRAREKDIVVEKLDDETLVYDLRTDQAHCLNSTATLVWLNCDGKTDVAGIAKKISAKIGQPVNPDVVQLALQNLTKSHLLDENAIAASSPVRVTRRELIRTVGKTAAIALPLITSIVAGEAQSHGSCIPSTTCSPSNPGRSTKLIKSCCCPTGAPPTLHSICLNPSGSTYTCSAVAPGC